MVIIINELHHFTLCTFAEAMAQAKGWGKN
jgi:hypothetical protein